MKTRLFVAIVLTFLVLGGIKAQAQSYPQHIDNHVNDFASVLPEADAEQLKSKLESFQSQTGIQIVIATINSISDFKTGDQTIEEFAKNLFNNWGVGSSEKNDGILMLVALNDRKVRIQLGSGYPAAYDSIMQDVINKTILPNFKSEAYSAGIIQGTDGIISGITKEVPWYIYYKMHLILGLLIVVLFAIGISLIKSGKKGWGWAFLTAAILLLIFLLKALFTGKKGSTGFGGGKSSGGGATGSW